MHRGQEQLTICGADRVVNRSVENIARKRNDLPTTEPRAGSVSGLETAPGTVASKQQLTNCGVEGGFRQWA